MARPRQVLKAAETGKELPRGRRVKDLNGVHAAGSIIEVSIFKVPVTVNDTLNDKQIKIMLEPCNTLAEIKQSLEKDSGLTPDNQKLSLNNRGLTNDNKTAEDYGIVDYMSPTGKTLILEPKAFADTVQMPSGATHTISVSPTDTTAAIKAKIHDVSGMSSPRQVLKHQGNLMPTDDNTTAADMGLQEGSIIHVEVHRVPVTVNTMDGKKIPIMVDPTDMLRDIKKQLAPDTGIAPGNQKLSMNGNELAGRQLLTMESRKDRNSVLNPTILESAMKCQTETLTILKFLHTILPMTSRSRLRTFLEWLLHVRC